MFNLLRNNDTFCLEFAQDKKNLTPWPEKKHDHPWLWLKKEWRKAQEGELKCIEDFVYTLHLNSWVEYHWFYNQIKLWFYNQRIKEKKGSGRWSDFSRLSQSVAWLDLSPLLHDAKAPHFASFLRPVLRRNLAKMDFWEAPGSVGWT